MAVSGKRLLLRLFISVAILSSGFLYYLSSDSRSDLAPGAFAYDYPNYGFMGRVFDKPWETMDKYTYRRIDDAMYQILDTMSRNNNMNASGVDQSLNKHTFIDINGDGLTDLLFHYNDDSDSFWSLKARYYGVFLNRGNFQFEVAYKCVVMGKYNPGTGSVPGGWFGDCGTSETYQDQAAEGAQYLFSLYEPYETVSDLDEFPGDSTLDTIFLLAPQLYPYYQYGSTTGYNIDSHPDYSLTDLNGDGLVDFIYHKASIWYDGDYSADYYIATNKGNLEFEQVYDCRFYKSDSLYSVSGDCAENMQE
jgi:hypothetical protein